MESFWRSFHALVRRNAIYRKRRWISSILEFVLPVVAVAIILALKESVSGSESFTATTVEPKYPSSQEARIPFSFQDYVTAMQVKRQCVLMHPGDDEPFEITGLPNKGWGWPVPFVKCDSRNCENDGEDATNYCEYQQLALLPSNPGDSIARRRVESFKNYILTRYPQLTNREVMPFDYDFIRTDFQSDSEIDDYVSSRDYGKSGYPKIGIAVTFTTSSSSSNSYAYEIRVNSTNFNAPEEELEPAHVTTPPTDRQFRSYAKEDDESCELVDYGPSLGPNENSCTAQYMYNGAISIQRLVNDWIIEDSGARNATGVFVAENGVSFVSFPTKQYEKDGFYSQIAAYGPLLIFLGLIFPVAACIRAICQEKELRQKELMKMMSVSETAIGWSWFVSLYGFYFFSALATAGTASAVYVNSKFGFLFLFWELTFLSSLLYSFTIAACFSKATRAVLIGLLGYFIGFILALTVDYQTMGRGAISVVSLHPVAAFSYGLQVIGDLEDLGVGITSSTYDYSDQPSGYAFNNTINSLIADCIIWGVLTWYLNRVVKGDYGYPLPWYFPILPGYWFPRLFQPQKIRDTDELMTENVRRSSLIKLTEPVSDALEEQKKEGRSVEICNLTKQFGRKTAVDGLTMSMYSGQVTALLGHNGAGKTTTINMLTGMIEPTSGVAVVAGKDIRTEMQQIRENVGICLQHDCLFPLLTVKEHIEFFARIKGVYKNKSRDEAKEAVKTSMEDVALLEKCNTLAKDLSGGMKRKLSVAVAFCGDSKVVFLDEPTSGMDPFSRRFTWNVIRQYRPGRCIILTTHFMDEADLLGDRIAIMAEGQLRCVGSSLFLKKSFGVGYQLTIEKRRPAFKNKANDQTEAVSKTSDTNYELSDGSSTDNISEQLIHIVKGSVREAKVLHNVGTEMTFHLPMASSASFPEMFESLDRLVENGDIVTYGVGITTLDEVFLMVARGQVGEKSQFASLRGSANILKTPVLDDSSHHSNVGLDGRSMFRRHVRALLEKRGMNFKRDKKAWCCTTILPVIFTLIGLLLVKFVSPPRDLDPLVLSLSNSNSDIQNNRNPIPYNEPGEYSCQPGQCLYPWTEFSESSTGEVYNYCGVSARFGFSSNCSSDYCGAVCAVEDSDNFVSRITEDGAFPYPDDVTSTLESSYSLANSSTMFDASQYGALFFTHDMSTTVSSDPNSASYGNSTFEACVSQHGNYTDVSQCAYFGGIGYTVAYNFTNLHASVIYQGLADEAIIREALNDNEFSITATINPLPFTYFENKYRDSSDGVWAWILLVLSFPFITGTFATFIVAERSSKAKHLQTVAGVRPSAYWISSFAWDVLNYQLPCWLVVILIYAFNQDTLTTTERGVAGGVIVTLLLFGPAAASFTYCITFLFKNAAVCNLFTIVFNILIGMALPLVTLNLRFFASNPEDDLEHLLTVAEVLEWIFRFIPSFCLGRGLLTTQFIETWSQIYDESDLTVWSQEGVLYEVIFMAIESVLYLWLAIKLDVWSANPRAVQFWRNFVNFITCRCHRMNKSSEPTPDEGSEDIPEDSDVAAEAERVLTGEANDDLIVLNQLTKIYPDGKLAVDHMSLGIPPGECFGLLGINGAGKTTTMGMLTAEFPPTGGDATLAGYSVTKEPEQTRRRIGYCPQFDAHFMNMTGLEHVMLYASIKGVPKDAVKEAAAAKLSQVGLNEDDMTRLSADYSGGMKRKLSVACALIGHPQIVFLDEPSTGMDPVARRELWQVISDLVVGEDSDEEEVKTSVVLTTHSMEECEALCPRIGIMAGGKLRCLGSAQHLKSRFGQNYQIELKIEDVIPSDEDYSSITARILSHLGVTTAPTEPQEDGTDVEGGSEAFGHSVAESTFIKFDQVKEVALQLATDGFLVSKISPDNPTGYVIYKNATSDVGVTVDELAAFCTQELRIKALLDFLEQTYESAILRERQDNKVRIEVGSEGLKVSSLFATIEDNKERLMLSDYSVSQTTLEQVFNMHAAMHANWHNRRNYT